MRHHLVIDELVLAGDLRGAIEHQTLPKNLCSKQDEMLVLGLRLVEHPLDRIGHAEAEIIEERLGNPALRGHGRQAAETTGRNPAMIRPRPPPPIPLPSGLLPAQDLVDLDAGRLEGFSQNGDAGVWSGFAAHEYVKGGIARIRPSMDGDVAFGEHRHAGNSVRLEMVHMDVQKRRVRRIHAAAQRRLDKIDIVKAFCPVQIDDQMDARTTHAIAQREMVVAARHSVRPHGHGFLRALPGLRRLFSDRKRAFWRIAVLPNRVIQPESPIKGGTGKRMPPDLPKRGQITAARPHIRLRSPESRRFCTNPLTVSAPHTVRDYLSLSAALLITRRCNPPPWVQSPRARHR